MIQWRWHYWSALRLPQRRPRHRHRSPDRPHYNRRLDYSSYCHQLEAQRHRLVSGDGTTLLWQIRAGGHLAGAMALVRTEKALKLGSNTNVCSAFGGMVAFCVIVGDTIPRVLDALFPSLSDTPFLWLLTNRRAIIILLILGISYPLSLYRDIAKVDPSRARCNKCTLT